MEGYESEKKKGRGRPKGSFKRKTRSLMAKKKTTMKTVDNNVEEVIYNDSGSSLGRSIKDSISICNKVTNNVLERTHVSQRRMSTGSTYDLKEARVVLVNIMQSNLISPAQRKKIFNKSHNSEDNSSELVPIKRKQKKKKSKKQSKALSVSTAAADSSDIFISHTIAKGDVLPKLKYEPNFSLVKVKVEPPREAPKVQPCRTRRLSEKSIENQSLEPLRKKSEKGCSIASKKSTDKPISTPSSSSSEQLESTKQKTESVWRKQHKTYNALDGPISFDDFMREGSSQFNSKAAKRRKQNDSEVKIEKIKLIKIKNFINKEVVGPPKKDARIKKKSKVSKKKAQGKDLTDSTKIPSKSVPNSLRKRTKPKAQNIVNSEPHYDNFGSLANGDLGSGDYSGEAPILSPKIAGSATPLPCNTRADVEIRANDRAPPAPFTSSGKEVSLDLDEKHCCLDSIARAIDNDLAAGNRLSPIADCLENIEMPTDLPTEGCCLSKMIMKDATTPNHPEHAQQDKERPREASERGSESHETSPDISVSNAASGTNRKRKCPAIVSDYILPKGTIPVASKLTPEKKKRRISSSTFGSESTTNNQNSAANDNAEYSISGESDVNLSSAIYALSKCPEIATLLQNNTVNDRLSIKSGCAIGYEDALNNNQDVNFANKNTLNGANQEDKIILYSSTSAASLDFMTEFNALSGLLNNFGETNSNDPKSIAEVENCQELESNDHEIDETIELFTASIVSRSSNKSNITEREECKPNASLTVRNVDRFDCVAGGSATTTKIASPERRRTFDTDSSRDEQWEDPREHSCGSTKPRKRKWVPSDNIKAAQAANQKIRLDRGNWRNEMKNQLGVSSAVGQGFAQPENCRVTNEASGQEPKKNDVAIDFSQSILNNHFQKPSSSVKHVQDRDVGVDTAVPGFGMESIYGVKESKSVKDTEVDESSESSSSGSSSSSDSSSSSSSSCSDSSDDESPSEKSPTRSEKNSCLSDSSMKSPPQGTRETMKEDRVQCSSEKVDENERAAGSFIENDSDAEKKVDEDEDDCISLFTESLCVSRCGSPSAYEPTKHTSSPLYKRMKSENIHPFVNANKRECDAVFEAYRDKVDDNKVDNDKMSKQKKTAIELPPIKEPLPQLERTNEIQIRPSTETEIQADLRSTLNNMSGRDMHILFRGQCFTWLKTGACKTQLRCRFLHVLKPQLQQIHLFNVNNIERILMFAIGNRYRHFIQVVQSSAVLNMTSDQILAFFHHLYRTRLLTDLNIKNTADALTKRGFSLKEVVSLLDSLIVKGDRETPERIIRALYMRVERGSCWETMRKLISKVVPPPWLVVRVLEECIKEGKSKVHVADVHENLIKQLPTNLSSNISGDLLNKFTDLLEISSSTHINTLETEREPMRCGESIASPDSPRASAGLTLPEQLNEVEKSTNALTPDSRVLQNGEYKLVRKISRPSSVSGSRLSSLNSSSSTYNMPPIDNLQPPKSPYSDVLWKFHWDLQGLQEGLRHRDYTHVKSILTQNINHPSRLPHMKGFYNILCKEIMSSKQHLAAIVRLTVQSGASNVLRQFVFDLGVHVLTKLADIGAWVLAYELLKTFQVYGTHNTCAYTLLAAEIYIANYRPLKALALLKQSQLLFTNTKVWNQMRCLKDEPQRVTVMDLLLSSLCDGHAQHALSLLEFILGDQCSSFTPINVSRHVDRVARALLLEKSTTSIIDFGRLIIQAHLSISRPTFRALINHIFHSDRFLAKQLHRYATWLGAYNTAKINLTTHMIVNSDWTEEEMYLMFSSLISDLSANIGHAIDRLGPRQLAVFLILETVPSEKHLCLDICDGPTTNKAIDKHKAIVQSVLERFDPKIKLVRRSQGRLWKVQSMSLVAYLKAGHIEH